MGSTIGVIIAAVMLTILPELLRALAHTQFVPPAYQGLLENRLIFIGARGGAVPAAGRATRTAANRKPPHRCTSRPAASEC